MTTTVIGVLAAAAVLALTVWLAVHSWKKQDPWRW